MKLKEYLKYGAMSLFAILLFTSTLSAKGEPVKKDPYKGPALALKNQEGEKVNLKDMEGKVVFINFWATWCPPCIAEMPNISKLAEQYKEDDQVVFLMISLDKKFDTAIDFLEKKGYAFDIQEPLGSIPKIFNTRGIPNTYVLGKTGEIEYKRMGMGNYNTQKFKDFLEELKAK